jgi:hypothetical protein
MDPRNIISSPGQHHPYPEDFRDGPPLPEPRRGTPVFFFGYDDAPSAPIPFNARHADIYRARR